MSESQDKGSRVIDEYNAVIILDGAEVKVKKVKAGRFYQLQRVYVDIIRKMQTLAKDQDIAKVSGTPTETEVNTIIRGDAFERMMGLYDELPEMFARFVALGTDMSPEEVFEKAYPEEIESAFKVIYDLNKIEANLKNSIAPMETIGAK